MIYGGGEYGYKSSDCAHCGAHSTSLTHGECFTCGVALCNRCASIHEGEADPETGYREEAWYCGVHPEEHEQVEYGTVSEAA